jgi:alanine-glyoxylate transaminase/serine-glyoxylate transaminase/serine-pyruvate transaminase
MTEPLQPPTRLLCGPGPSNVHPDVLAAMSKPILGHLDPEFWAIATEISTMLGQVYGRADGFTLALSASGTSGMEAGVQALLEPGDTAIVGVGGFFGNRLAELVRRHGATLVEVRVPYGEMVPNEDLVAALDAHPEASLVAVVYAETSTGVAHDLAGLGAALAGRDVLLLADCVTAIGGMPIDVDGWGVDYAYGCTQKCLGAPPGISPVTLSERALARIERRTTPTSLSFDFTALRRYWEARPAVYHHTLPILQMYALHEALRLALDEGLEARYARHAAAGDHLQATLRARGLDLLADPAHQLAQLTAPRVPAGIVGADVQRRLLFEQGIEIGGGLGPDAPAIWRIGLMGVNAEIATADRVADALHAALADG